MNILLLLAALSCPEIQMTNDTDEKWTKRDYEDLAEAKIRCGEIYPDSPCVTEFNKYAHQAYRVTCGKKR